MRQATTRNAPRFGSTSRTFSFPAPLGGVNSRDGYPNMPLTDCIFMNECYPGQAGIITRGMKKSYATGFATGVESLIVYTAATGTETLFAAAGGNIYDISSAGAIGAAVVSGMTNAKWQWVNYTNSGGTAYLCLFNGADKPQYWNGTTWIPIDGGSTPAITGVTTTTLVHAFVHQRRMWLTQVNSLDMWYLPIDSVGGAATKFSLAGLATKGGYVMAGGTWTVDAGDGINDYWAAITNKGQLIVYQGYDPSSASSWELVGVWNLSEPMDRTCMGKFRNDLLIITKTGVVSTQQVLSGNTGTSANITDKNSGNYLFWATTAPTIAATYSNTRWQLINYDKKDLLILLMGEFFAPIAMNRSTGAWSGQMSLGGLCAAIFNGDLYTFGGTLVYKCWDSTATESITIDIFTAFSNFQSPGVLKQLKQSSFMADSNGTTIAYKMGNLKNYFLNSNTPSFGSLLSNNVLTGYSTPYRQMNYGESFSIALEANVGNYGTNNPTIIYGMNAIYEPSSIMGIAQTL